MLDLLLEKSDKTKKLYQLVKSYMFFDTPPVTVDLFIHELADAINKDETEKANFCLS